jgi:[NiFe] hydrogenase diaphorase moiety small subunit
VSRELHQEGGAWPSFSLDGEEVPFNPGDTILQAATRVGRYIPHLCWIFRRMARAGCAA